MPDLNNVTCAVCGGKNKAMAGRRSSVYVSIIGSRDYPSLGKVDEYVSCLIGECIVVTGGARLGQVRQERRHASQPLHHRARGPGRGFLGWEEQRDETRDRVREEHRARAGDRLALGKHDAGVRALEVTHGLHQGLQLPLGHLS